MKLFLHLIIKTLCLLGLGMAAAHAATLTLKVEDLRDTEGRVAIAVFNSESGFPDDDAKAIRRVYVPLQQNGQIVTTTLKDLAPGNYAIALFHDHNLSGKLETNLFGIPRKGYGFSNNVNPSLRSARFDEAVFTLPEEGRDVTIKVIYR